MLEMMPGSLLDKTNNNLSTIACLHSNISKEVGEAKEYVMDTPQTPNPSSEVVNLVAEDTTVPSVPEQNSTTMAKPSKRISSAQRKSIKADNIQKKILSILNKFNISKEKFYTKLSRFKRETIDKRRPNRVLSFKVKRCIHKQGPLKWSNRLVSVKHMKAAQQIGNKPKANQDALASEVGRDKGGEPEVTKSNILLPIIPSFKADDDIRNKIKQQLELLRTNRKISTRCTQRGNDEVDNEPGTSDTGGIPENGTERSPPIESCASTSTSTVHPDLSEIILSNEDTLSIVNVVGGYVSDEETPEPSIKIEPDVQSIDEASFASPAGKGTSITDILLKRDFSASPDDAHLITPKKTRDITKIKGWRGKQFFVTTSHVKSVPDVDPVPEEAEGVPEEAPVVWPVRETVPKPCVDGPSTSADFSAYDAANSPATGDAHLLPVAGNILKQGEDAASAHNVKSAFVSDVLDTFLSNHAELKISYEVPKLVAEESITKLFSDMPVAAQEYLVVDQTRSGSKGRAPKKQAVKPKTLAEKRRMLETDRQNKLLQDMAVNEIMYLKRLEYCDTSYKPDIARDVRASLLSAQVPFSRRCWSAVTRGAEDASQCVLLNGERIRIAGSCGGTDLEIKEMLRRTSDVCGDGPPAFTSGCGVLNRFSKPTLLESEHRRAPGLKRPLQYRPGPLSKKRKLMRGAQAKENWECHVLRMPRIKLVLYPEQGKRIPVLAEKYLQLCRSEQGFISDEWARFAVSAVRCETSDKTQVEFELPYANRQNKLLVRKRVYPAPALVSADAKLPDANVEDTIKQMMDDMLNCIESRQLDRLIIKDDPDLQAQYKTNVDEGNCAPPSPIDSMVKAIIKRPNAKKSKTTLELRRLNVQVIEVDVKEDEADSVACTNDFCRLGCVCKSLRGSAAIVPAHCGQEQCMLECTCTFGAAQRVHHSITLPAGTDLLSASTVVRLQDEVKRNLAKEERKFTQTVIKANNQTIMVGGGARDRQRRVPKVPKKYSNYVQKSNKSLSYMEMISNGLLEDEQDPDFTVNKYQKTQLSGKGAAASGVLELKKPIPIWIKDGADKPGVQPQKECRVQLQRLQLEHVMPWCMVHNLYKCHCGGRTATQVVPAKNTDEQLGKSASEEVPAADESIPYASRLTGRHQPAPASAIEARTKARSFKARHAKDPAPVPAANKTGPKRKKQQKRTRGEESRADSTSDSGDSDCVPVSRNKEITIVDVDDILNSREDSEPMEESSSDAMDRPCHLVTTPSFIDYDRSYVGLLIPSEEWIKRFLDMMKADNKGKYQIRLLEWGTLVKRQKNGSIQMWFKNNKYNNIVLTEDRRRPSRNHMNIKLFENTPLDKFKVPSIITSILSGTLPSKATKASDTYVILLYDGLTWEARGTMLLTATPELCRTRLGHRFTPVNILNPYLAMPANMKRTYSILKPIEKNADSQLLHIRSTPTMSVEVIQNPLASPPPALQPISKGVEITKVVVDDNSESSSSSVIVEKRTTSAILVPLPSGAPLMRWYALILENDFSVLRISDTNFHIKYTHLNTAIQMARNNRRTVRIRSHDSNRPGRAGQFGIYALREHGDRIFFGPYANGKGHGLETFRYVNSKLVNTKIYYKMRGTPARTSTGVWFRQTSLINNRLYLELESDESHSSSSECFTEMTSVENAVKPQIEFVDLTGNDSDNEDSSVDPLFNVLSADFSKKVSADVTIEPVRANKNKAAGSAQLVNESITNTSVILEIKKTSDILNLADRKRKSASVLPDEPAKKEPKIIDSITLDLDDDDEMPSTAPSHKETQSKNVIASGNNARQMPKLQLISDRVKGAKQTKIVFKPDNVTYVITNIPGVGYFQIGRFTCKYRVLLNMENKPCPVFLTVKNAITWLELLFHKSIYFMPVNLKIQFSHLQSTEIPAMPKFNENYLNGFHMICEKGIFDLLHMSTNQMDNLGFSETDSAILLAHKCELLIKRDIKLLGQLLFTPEEYQKMDEKQILAKGPDKIKFIEDRQTILLREKQKLWNHQQQLLHRINVIIVKGVPPTVKSVVKKNIVNLFNAIPSVKLTDTFGPESPVARKNPPTTSDKVYKVPVGKICKIVDGKVVVTDKPMVSVTRDLSIIKTTGSKPTAPYPVKLMSSAAMQAYPQPANADDIEMLVPITGLQSPATVVGLPPLVPKKSPTTSLLFSKKKPQASKVVDLTDD